MSRNQRYYHFGSCQMEVEGGIKKGIDLYQRERDRTFYIIEDGKRVNVAIKSGFGEVIKI